MLDRLCTEWRRNEFFAFFGLRLGRERKWAESFCSLPSRLAARDGAQVGLHRSLILRTGFYTIAQLALRFLSGDLLANLKESRWTFAPRKSGHFKPRFCGHFFPLLTIFAVDFFGIEDIAQFIAGETVETGVIGVQFGVIYNYG